MSKRNRKQWTLTLNDELEKRINNYKKLYNLHDNKDVINHLLDTHLNIKPTIQTSLNKVCDEFNITKEELLTPVIEQYVNKTLKKQKVVKEKNKHTEKSEFELQQVLNDMVNYYKRLPVENRKYITPTLVNKYIIINHDKYKQKNRNVIKRVFDGLSNVDISFIKKYHEENNLTVRSNLKR